MNERVRFGLLKVYLVYIQKHFIEGAGSHGTESVRMCECTMTRANQTPCEKYINHVVEA